MVERRKENWYLFHLIQIKWNINMSGWAGPKHDCRYPEDRIPLCTISKLRQEAVRASMCCHISCTFGSHLPAEVGSGATTCPTAPDLASVLR
jgi:hypothetical protein